MLLLVVVEIFEIGIFCVLVYLWIDLCFKVEIMIWLIVLVVIEYLMVRLFDFVLLLVKMILVVLVFSKSVNFL